jgi:hypothetical protein
MAGADAALVDAQPKSGYQRYVAIVYAKGRLTNPSFSYKQAMVEAGEGWKTCSDREALQTAAKQDLLKFHIAIGKKKAVDPDAVRKGRFEKRTLQKGWERRVIDGTAYFVNMGYDLAIRSFPCTIDAFEKKLSAPKKRKADEDTDKPPKVAKKAAEQATSAVAVLSAEESSEEDE